MPLAEKPTPTPSTGPQALVVVVSGAYAPIFILLNTLENASIPESQAANDLVLDRHFLYELSLFDPVLICSTVHAKPFGRVEEVFSRVQQNWTFGEWF